MGNVSLISGDMCRKPDSHEYELYLAIENIDHTRTTARCPQIDGICERFHKTLLDEFYRVAFRKKLYRRIDELQADLDAWLVEYNEQRPHQGRWCYGKTPMQTFIDTLPEGEIDAGLAGGEQAQGRVTSTASFNRTAHPRLTKRVRASLHFSSSVGELEARAMARPSSRKRVSAAFAESIYWQRQ